MNDYVRALQKLVVEQFRKPEWVIWTRKGNNSHWVLTLDFVNTWSLNVEFAYQGSQVDIIKECDGDSVTIRVDYGDPECDQKVAVIIKEWFVQAWEKTGLMDAGYTNPIADKGQTE